MFGEKEKRFVVKYREKFAGGELIIVVDKNTGVNYISMVNLGAAASFCPLLDENGEVVVDK